MRQIQCKRCGAYIAVEEQAEQIQCPNCKARYQKTMKSASGGSVQNISYAGRGVLFQAYIPDGWSCRITEDPSVSVLAAVCKGMQLESPQGGCLCFAPFAYYKNYMPGERGMSIQFMGQPLQDYFVDGGQGICYRRLVNPRQYAFERLGAAYGMLEQVDIQPAENCISQSFLSGFWQEASQKLGKQVRVEPYCFSVQCVRYNQRWQGYFATVYAVTEEAVAPKKQAGFMDVLKKGLSGGILGNMLSGQNLSDWGRAFDVMLLVPESSRENGSMIFRKFIESLRYGALYYALQQEELQNVQQVTVQGTLMRQQNAMRASQHLSRTLSETSDIVNQTCWNNSQHLDRMNEKYSEMARGVNSYMDTDGTRYEADVKYDHVYRKGDTYAGSMNGSADLGPDWEELKRR